MSKNPESVVDAKADRTTNGRKTAPGQPSEGRQSNFHVFVAAWKRLSRSIVGRIALEVLACHLIMLPTLFFAVVYLVGWSEEEFFLQDIKHRALFIAENLQRTDNVSSNQATERILSIFVESGDGMYATLVDASGEEQISVTDGDFDSQYIEDTEFGEHDDSIYFTSVPLKLAESNYSLLLGFDERPIVASIRQAYLRGAAILAIYLIVVLTTVVWIGRRVLKPIRIMQNASRKVASGALAEHIEVDTELDEFVALAHDLDSMRKFLIGINEQLHEEIRRKELAEFERQSLERQLRHRQRLETIDTLAGGIAHELNNIMVPILLYSESALDELPEDDRVREDLTKVVRAASRARNIVQQILVFSRQMESLDVHRIDSGKVVRESIDLMRASFGPTVDLRVDIDVDCPQILGNSSLFGQVLINLCTNAYQALPNGRGVINVSLKREEITSTRPHDNPGLREGVYAKLTVADSGEGIDAITLDRIFEPFFTTRQVGEGTGLGLSVVHGIVASMAGEISVSSNVGQGTAFVVYFPALKSQEFVA